MFPVGGGCFWDLPSHWQLKLVMETKLAYQWAILDSNQRPQSYQDCALTN
jgi:hypothetical protein